MIGRFQNYVGLISHKFIPNFLLRTTYLSAETPKVGRMQARWTENKITATTPGISYRFFAGPTIQARYPHRSLRKAGKKGLYISHKPEYFWICHPLDLRS